MKLCWFGCGILAVLLALSLLCGMLTQRSTRMPPPRSSRRSKRWTGTRRRRPWRPTHRPGSTGSAIAAFCAVLSHDELDGIEQGFAELQAYSAVGDAAELRSRREVLTAAAAAHRAAGRAVCRELSHLPGADLGRLVIPRSEATWNLWQTISNSPKSTETSGPVLQNCTLQGCFLLGAPAGAMQ